MSKRGRSVGFMVQFPLPSFHVFSVDVRVIGSNACEKNHGTAGCAGEVHVVELGSSCLLEVRSLREKKSSKRKYDIAAI